jgi:hypothetical protein
LAYVNEGGNLLVTGPLERDEHWHTVTRAAEFSIGARSEPLTYRRAALRLDHHTIWLSFDQQRQSCLEALRFADGTTVKEISLGNGRIFWATFPVELSEGIEAATDLYAYVAGRLNIAPLFEPLSALSPGVMLYPVVLEDSVLYVAVSESSGTSEIDIRDKLTGVRLTFALAGEHAALALIGKQEKRAIAKYGF